MDTIQLVDYEVSACHGVNEEEKIIPQRFLVTATIYCDLTDAAKSDDVMKTISYADVKKDIKCLFEQNCYNLIETLAYKLCNHILLKYPLAKGVEICIKKPDAPMKGVFKYPCVTIMREWHKAYLSLGSSIGDKDAYLDFAIKMLSMNENIKGVKESSRLTTSPYGNIAKNDFVNSAVELYTLYNPQELLYYLNEIEAKANRKRDIRWGDRTLDIDIIFYDNLIIEDDNLCIPHPDMHNRYFVLKPLFELCPNKLHPVLNVRVRDLLTDLHNFERVGI